MRVDYKNFTTEDGREIVNFFAIAVSSHGLTSQLLIHVHNMSHVIIGRKL